MQYFGLLLFGVVWCKTVKQQQQPNVILMVADDLGYGDIGCFGNTTLSTPNIDRLAESGAKLTHVLAASAVCTPSRAALLTGRYPVRSGLAPADYGVYAFVASSGGLSSNETTFAEIFKSAGYATAIIGKWHLGLHCDWYGDNCHHPSVHGFDHFYGLPIGNMEDWTDSPNDYVIWRFFPYMYRSLMGTIFVGILTTIWLCCRKTTLAALLVFSVGCVIPLFVCFLFSNPIYLNGIIVRNDDVVEQPVRLWTLARRFVHETKQFVQEQHDSGKPFMVFLSFSHVHTVLSVHPEFEGRSKHGLYGDSVEEMDWMVGQVTEHLKSLNIINNTIVIFTSDHGAHIEEDPRGSNGIFSGGKLMYGIEGGIRVPTIVSWPGVISENVTLSAPASLMDLYPTMLDMAKVNWKPEKPLDGKSLVSVVSRKTVKSPHQYLFHYGKFDSIDALTYIENETNVWKVHFKFPNWIAGKRVCHKRCRYPLSQVNDPPVIYNVFDDPAELNALDSDSSKYKAILLLARKAMADHTSSVTTVPSELDFNKVLWKPWLQSCCNFPRCFCQENIRHLLY